MGFGVWGLGFGVWGLRFAFHDLWCVYLPLLTHTACAAGDTLIVVPSDDVAAALVKKRVAAWDMR